MVSTLDPEPEVSGRELAVKVACPSAVTGTVPRTVRPVDSSSSTRTSGRGARTSSAPAGISQWKVACEWGSSKVSSGSRPGTDRRVVCR